jgi:hypothetical protein
MKKILSIICLLFLSALPVNFVFAQHFPPEAFENKTDFYFQEGDIDGDGIPEVTRGDLSGEVKGAIYLGERDPRLVIAGIINILLGFIGIISLLVIIAGGLKLVIASGNVDQGAEAKKMFWNGIIGLIIVFSAYGIAHLIIASLAQATGM